MAKKNKRISNKIEKEGIESKNKKAKQDDLLDDTIHDRDLG
jgi:hypothetical protein